MKKYLLCSMLALAVLAGYVFGQGQSDGDKKETESSLKKAETTDTKPKSDVSAKTCSEEDKKKCAAGTKPEGKTCSAEEMKKCASGTKPEGKTCCSKEDKKPEGKTCCSAEEVKKSGVQAKETSSVAEKTGKDKVFVTVNGVEIMRSEIDKQVDKMMGSRAASMPPEQIAKMKPMAQQRVANMMVDKQLFGEKIKAKKIEISKEQIDMKIEEIAGQRNKTSSDFLKELAANGVNASDVKEEIEIMLGVEKLIDTEAAAEVAVTKEDAEKYYDGNSRRFSQSEQVRASHILIKTEGFDEAGKAAAKAKIDGLLKQVKEGADFAELAKANSDCPSGSGGGDLNFFERGRMVPEFDKVAFELKENEISGIVETKFGYHIIKQTGRKDAKTTSFEEAKAGILEEMKGRKKGEFGRKYLEQLKAEAKIVWSEEAEKIMQAAPSMRGQPRRPAKPPMPSPKPKPVKVKPKPVEPVKN